MFRSIRRSQVSSHTKEMRFQKCLLLITEVSQKLDGKHSAEKLPGFVTVLWYFSPHFVFCGQQGSWESWLSFSVELFLTIVCRKPWKSEARTPKSIRKIGGREETLQLFFKQSLHGSLRQLLWFLQGTDLDFFKSLCLAVLKIICCDMFKHILGINNEEIWSCNNQMECVTLFGLDLLWELHLIKSNGNFVYHAKKKPSHDFNSNWVCVQNSATVQYLCLWHRSRRYQS